MCRNRKIPFLCRHFSILEKMSGLGKVLFLVRSSKLKMYYIQHSTVITYKVMHLSFKYKELVCVVLSRSTASISLPELRCNVRVLPSKRKSVKGDTTPVGFELTHSKSNGLAIHRLNHSATVSFLPPIVEFKNK